MGLHARSPSGLILKNFLKGHNGAGKSTTISMICGLYRPSSGNILVDNYNVVNETKKARSKLGYCPQHNLLFDDLTVNEHLVFFSKLKENYNEYEIDEILGALNLADKRNAKARTLSGGMKR
jgi:ABC-type multidrug transport system ATPase subunit